MKDQSVLYAIIREERLTKFDMSEHFNMFKYIFLIAINYYFVRHTYVTCVVTLYRWHTGYC